MMNALSNAFRNNWSIVPVNADKKPQFSWKEYQDRLPSKEELDKWKQLNAPAWAVITGKISNIVVIDFDGEKGRDTCHKLGLNPHVKTGSGGYHLYVEHPGHLIKTLNSKSKKELGEKYPGLDVRGDGGYAVFFGHNCSGSYEWLRDMTPDPIGVLPQDVRIYLGLEESVPDPTPRKKDDRSYWTRVEHSSLLEKYIGQSYNGRNDAGFNLACQLRDNGYSYQSAEVVMKEYANRVSNLNTKGHIEPYTINDAIKSLKSAYSQPPRTPWVRAKEKYEKEKLAPRKDNQEFLNLIPQPSFLDRYTRYASDMTDSPPEFHLAVGLAILSAAVGNHIWFNAWGQPVYLNLWNVILAPSGFYRKSTAMRIGLNLLGEECRENMLPNDFTKEKLIEDLSLRPRGIIPVWEFGSLLKAMNADYNGGMKEMLTEIYDAPFYERVTKGGVNRIDKPAVSILAASTIDWVIDRITGGDLNSGFLARFLYWPATQKNGWKGFNCEINPQDKEYLTEFLHFVIDVRGELTFPKDVKKQYDVWLRNHEEEVNEQKLPSVLQGFYTRIATYVLKFAALYELSMTQDLEVTEESLHFAINLAEYLKSHLIKLIEEDIVTTKDAKELKAIKDIIRSEAGIDRATVLRKSHMMSNRLNQLLDTLIQSGDIRTETIKTERRNKQIFWVE